MIDFARRIGQVIEQMQSIDPAHHALTANVLGPRGGDKGMIGSSAGC